MNHTPQNSYATTARQMTRMGYESWSRFAVSNNNTSVTMNKYYSIVNNK